MKIELLFSRHILKTLFGCYLTLIFTSGCSEKDVLPPVLESVSPSEGYIGDPVTLTGKNLGNPTRIVFNQIDSDIALGTNTLLTTVVPNNAATGVNLIAVQNEGGMSNTVSFNVIEDNRVTDPLPPVLSKLYPGSNYWKKPILIYGDNLSAARVTINGVAATVSTNNKKVVTTTIPDGVPPGVVKLKITTPKGESNSLDLTVSGPPPAGSPVVNFTLVSVPPPGYVPVISNDWSCGLLSLKNSNNEPDNYFYSGVFESLDVVDDEGNSLIEGYYEFAYNLEKGYNTLNFVEMRNIESGEIWVGQFSSEFDFPCVLEMVLMSTVTGEIFVCDFDRSSFGDPCDS
jgi:hypothetical protein